MKLIIIIATFLSLNLKAENFPALFQNFSGICINSLDNLEVVYDYAKENTTLHTISNRRLDNL